MRRRVPFVRQGLAGQAWRASVLAGFLLVEGCATTDTASRPLAADLGGTFAGTATLAASGRGPVPYSLRLRVILSGATASLRGVCPGVVDNASLRGGRLRLPTESSPSDTAVGATGGAASASWAGSLDCPPVEWRGCGVVRVTYRTVDVTLSGPNQLTLVATGSAEACGVTSEVFLTFLGTRSPGS